MGKRPAWRFWISNIPEIISALALTLAISITVVNVVSRYVFSKAIIGVDELVSMCFCWAVYAGAAAAYKRKMHMGIEILVDALPSRIGGFVRGLVKIILLVSSLYVTYLSWVLADSAWIKTTSYWRISYYWVDLSLVFCFACISYYTAKELIYRYFFKREATYYDVEEDGEDGVGTKGGETDGKGGWDL